MANHASPTPDQSLASLIGGIINDAKDLMLHEFLMAKLEMQDELRKTKTAAMSFAIGAGVAVVGVLWNHRWGVARHRPHFPGRRQTNRRTDRRCSPTNGGNP
jgi:hypothetical protein